MKKSLTTLLWFLGLAVILWGGWQGMRYMQKSQEVELKAPEAESELGAIKVAVHSVETGSISQDVWITGEVRALQSVDIVPKVSGRLEQLRLSDGTLIEEGIEVKEGETVAIIEHEQYAAAVRAAETGLAVAKAAREIARVNLTDTEREKNRYVELYAAGACTQQELDRAVTAYERGQAQLEQAEAQINQAEAALDQAKINLEESTIEAPFSGLVVHKYLDEGSFVGPSTPLFKLADISVIEITGGLAGIHYEKLGIGETKAIIEVDAYPEERFEGTLSRIRPELDRATRTVVVTIRIDNPKHRLKPGMYARIRVLLEERENVPLVPDQALVYQGGKTLAYVVNNGIVHVREVKIGLEEGAKNEVLEGLQPGDKVVIRGQTLLSDGVAVEAVEEVKAQ